MLDSVLHISFLSPSLFSFHPSISSLNKYCLSCTSCPQQPGSRGDGVWGSLWKKEAVKLTTFWEEQDVWQ